MNTATIAELLPFDHHLGEPEAPHSALVALGQTLALFGENPTEPAALLRLRRDIRSTTEEVLAFPRQPEQASLRHEVFALVREMGRCGAHDFPVEPADLALADRLARRDWRGVLAAMLLVPAWQWPTAPVVAEVVPWLRPDFVRWLFTAPGNFHQFGQAEQYQRFHHRRLEELQRWLRRSPDEREITAVLGAYASHAALRASAVEGSSFVAHAGLRARLLQRYLAQPDDHYRAPLRSRSGRRLRVGVVHRHFCDDAATAALAAVLPARNGDAAVDVLLFSFVNDFSVIEDSFRRRVADFRLLPNDLKAQLELLRGAALDVVLFSDELTGACTVITRLALHRVAPLQVALSRRGLTTALPEIDLLLVSAGAENGDFSERIAVYSGAWPLALPAAITGHAAERLTRAEYGIPSEARLLVSLADYRQITPEVRAAWAQMLQADPQLQLFLHPFAANRPPEEIIQQFYQGCVTALRLEGVEESRLIVSTVPFESTSALTALLELGDARLDCPGGKVESSVAATDWSLSTIFIQTYDELVAQGRSAFQARSRPLVPVG